MKTRRIFLNRMDNEMLELTIITINFNELRKLLCQSPQFGGTRSSSSKSLGILFEFKFYLFDRAQSQSNFKKLRSAPSFVTEHATALVACCNHKNLSYAKFLLEKLINCKIIISTQFLQKNNLIQKI